MSEKATGPGGSAEKSDVRSKDQRLARINELMDAVPGTPEGDELDRLVNEQAAQERAEERAADRLESIFEMVDKIADGEPLTSKTKDQWRSIETAPKDGSFIVLGYFLEAGGGGAPEVAFWHSTHQKWCNRDGLLNAENYFSPTHWLPLPEPPQ